MTGRGVPEPGFIIPLSIWNPMKSIKFFTKETVSAIDFKHRG